MYKKTLYFLGIVLTIGSAFIMHFIYEHFPNFLTLIFFPINESIWEHMKLLFSSFVLYGILEYFIFKYFKLPTNNYFLYLCGIAFLSIPLYLAFYIPFYLAFGENMLYTIGLMILVIISLKLIQYQKINKATSSYNVLGIMFIILGYVIFFVLSKYPPNYFLFIDPTK